jgi:hypothetical protein
MFDPLYLLTLLPAWLVGMTLLLLARRKFQKEEEQRVPATVPVRER